MPVKSYTWHRWKNIVIDEVLQFGKEHGYPIIIKAVSGGGGKGMRIVNNKDEVQDAYDRTKSEAIHSFGNDALYVENISIILNILKCKF